MNKAALKAWLPWIAMGLIVCAYCALVWWQFGTDHGHRHGSSNAPVICIDPGHPSETNSARHHINGTCELEMNWVMALHLRDALKDLGVETVMTKKSCDEFVFNHTRAIIGNECGADLTIHLHCDAGPGRGFTVYYPDKQGTIEGKTGPSQDVIDASRSAAWLLHDGMSSPLQGWLHDRGIKGDSMTKIGHKRGTLTTSAFSLVPTLTVEMCFLTNKHDACFIESQQGQRRLTHALASGVVRYLLSRGYVQKDGKLIRK